MKRNLYGEGEYRMQKPILKDFPNEFYTKRLYIRLPKPGDGESVYFAIDASKDDLKKWLPFAQKNQSMEDVETNVRESYIKFLKREDMRMHIFSRETGDLIGCTGLHRIDWEVPKFEIGYWIDSRKSGHGYITEAVQGITDYAFKELGANRIEIRCDVENRRSKAIPERLGFKMEGILQNDDVAVDGDGLRDTCIFAKIK
ncbi:Protein N-acetyltransferase, RimJ/RimL family [Virgibacillus salinus]|uniref:Protein N-acetyltransferase, RimJ/RimL family n=2 Tax=Virgibacillus salinus TaxID=553311 RepID=A0A1H1FYV7_9BACI|nr:Protein N-acetyltransferase, RimJ/RimL family [Virgibacillus salinus]